MPAAEAGLRRLAAPVGVALILLTLAAAPLVASWRLTDSTPAAARSRVLPPLPGPRPGDAGHAERELATVVGPTRTRTFARGRNGSRQGHDRRRMTDDLQGEVDGVLGASPVGTKGVGEIGIVGVAPAIANAVFHATGRRDRCLPIAVEQLL